MLGSNCQNGCHGLFALLLVTLITNVVCKNVEIGLRPKETNIGQYSLNYGLRNGLRFKTRRETNTETDKAEGKSTRTVSLKCTLLRTFETHKPWVIRNQLVESFHLKECGVKPIVPKTRIVGGVESVPHSRPWMAALSTNRGFLFCGGTIVNNIYIVTAGHCVIGKNARDFHVILGLHDKFNDNQKDSGTYHIKSITIHPNYDQTTVDNDIALLQLTERIDFNDKVLPVCLPQFNADFSGAKGIVAGWGMLIDSGPTSRMLQEVNLPVLSNADCKSKYHNGLISDNMMCAGLASGGQDACQGDSGGPMLYQVDGRWNLIGVVSWGNGCAQPNQPGVYTNVSRYVKWIYSETGNAVYCW